MKDNREALRPYLADMAAVEKHIVEALERQHEDDDIKQFPRALGLIDRILRTLKSHVSGLETHLASFPGGGVAATVKETVTGLLGGLAGIYDKVRKDTASRALRDDYTALALAAVSYNMLHTTALGLRQGTTAEIALNNLREIAPLLMELGEAIPEVVARELALEGYDIEPSVAQQAARDVREAWSSGSHEEAQVGVPGGTSTNFR